MKDKEFIFYEHFGSIIKCEVVVRHDYDNSVEIQLPNDVVRRVYAVDAARTFDDIVRQQRAFETQCIRGLSVRIEEHAKTLQALDILVEADARVVTVEECGKKYDCCREC